jgi:hypothetical protein
MGLVRSTEGKTKGKRTRNEKIRENLKINALEFKLKYTRMCYGHVLRTPEGSFENKSKRKTPNRETEIKMATTG